MFDVECLIFGAKITNNHGQEKKRQWAVGSRQNGEP
jgi:hypothetical protein